MASHMNEILPGLFIGNYADAKDDRSLRSHQITHIVSLMDKVKHDFPDKHYMCIMESDSYDTQISDYFSVVNDFIHEARLQNKNVLVHCLHGVSLSAAMIIAYIMTVTKLNWFNALNVVRAERCFALPLPGLLAQLEEFQRERLYVERCRLEYKFAKQQIGTNDLDYCQKALHYFDMLANSNPNFFDRVPDFESVPPEGTEQTEGPSTSTGVRRRKKLALLETEPLRGKPKVKGGGTLVMENVLVFDPVSLTELGKKGKFVDPIDQVRKRHRYTANFKRP